MFLPGVEALYLKVFPSGTFGQISRPYIAMVQQVLALDAARQQPANEVAPQEDIDQQRRNRC